MKKILIVLLTMVLLLAGCGKNGASSPQSPSDESVADRQKPSSSETEISSEDHAIPGSYTVPEGWEKSEKHSTDSQIFYIEEGHENDEKPDNISIHVGKNKYSLEEHEQFRDAIVQQILMQLDGIEAQLNGDGTYTEQGDLLYIFTIDEGRYCHHAILYCKGLRVLPDPAYKFQRIRNHRTGRQRHGR